MPYSEGISAQYLDETLLMRDQNRLTFTGNAASKNACIKYLEEVDNQCFSKNSTFTQSECEKYCGKWLFYVGGGEWGGGTMGTVECLVL